jgi:integrase
MSQYKRKIKKGDFWWYKFSFNNETYFSKAIYLSKNEAKRAEGVKYEELSLNERNPTQKPILSLMEAINERLDFVKVKKSIVYYKDNKRYYKILFEKLGNCSIDEIKRPAIENILLDVSKKQKSKGGDNYVVNTMLAVYKVLFNYVVERHDLSIKNPCTGIKLFSINKKLKYIPSDNDIEAIRSVCDDGQKALIDFVMESGCRINEALRLSVENVNSDNIVLYTRKSRNSNLVPRKIPIPKSLNITGLKPQERVFSRWDDTPKFLTRKVKELGQKSWSWHNLRHRYASLLSKNGKPLFEIMILLGHSNLKTTQNYLQLIA